MSATSHEPVLLLKLQGHASDACYHPSS